MFRETFGSEESYSPLWASLINFLLAQPKLLLANASGKVDLLRPAQNRHKNNEQDRCYLDISHSWV
jgi:hypothetical protein